MLPKLTSDFNVLECDLDVNFRDWLIEKNSIYSNYTMTKNMVSYLFRELERFDIVRKVNNRKYIFNPYQYYKRINLNSFKLYQLQVYWDNNKELTRFMSAEEYKILLNKAEIEFDSMNIAKNKIEADSIAKEINCVETEIKRIDNDEDGIFTDMLIKFSQYYKDKGDIAINQSLAVFLDNDENFRFFRNWYLKFSSSEKCNLDFPYRARTRYREAFIKLVNRHNDKRKEQCDES